MNRRATGAILLGISAFIYGLRLLSAAIMGSDNLGWHSSKYNQMLDHIGNDPVVVCWMTLIAGIAYLIWAEIDSIRTAVKLE